MQVVPRRRWIQGWTFTKIGSSGNSQLHVISTSEARRNLVSRRWKGFLPGSFAGTTGNQEFITRLKLNFCRLCLDLVIVRLDAGIIANPSVRDDAIVVKDEHRAFCHRITRHPGKVMKLDVIRANRFA
jgi:hypothetical protein